MNKVGICKAFDCYCKKAMRNELKKYFRDLNRRQSREVLFSELSPREQNELCTYDRYFTEDNTFTACGYKFCIDDEKLAAALRRLSDEIKDIILLSFFSGFSDRKIGVMLSIPRATVQYRRRIGIDTLTDYIKPRQER